jgi:predicted SAM-dependent methyltransferase
VKLNLGSGVMPFNGFINMDAVKVGKNDTKLSIVADMGYLPFKFNSVTNIVSIHSLSEIGYRKGVSCLKQCYSVLKPGGSIVIEDTDLVKSFIQFSSDAHLLASNIYGDQKVIEQGNDFYFHRWGWTGEEVAKELRNVGFTSIVVTNGEMHGRPKRDFRVTGIKQ